ncbi:hypothetical protein EZS27_022716 [termite gut metagenome]|uniref:Uncharacterized protein n=1 Tax=termite gut metagenome TaxID=433724 RepID=A0A5J4R4B3_9ZZZZ
MYSTSDIPQADRLEKVVMVIDAVNEGNSSDTQIAEIIGFSDRQARYYRHAAEILGFIDNNHNNAIITDIGEKFAESIDNERTMLLRKSIVQNHFFSDVLNFFERNPNGVTEEEVVNHIISVSDREAHNTILRRIKTILSWLVSLEFIIESNEKYICNENVEIDFDESSNEESIYPANYAKEIDIKEDKFSVFELLRKIENKKIIMDPDFQRKLVWKKNQFIESILLNVPLPPFYFKKDIKGNYTIVDGLQRTSTLQEFLNNKFALQGLNALPDLQNSYFNDLNDDLRTRIEDKNLLIYVLQPSVPMIVVYDIFNRINTGGTKLERQEIRNCIFIGESTKLLRKLADTIIFKDAIDRGIPDTRMKD